MSYETPHFTEEQIRWLEDLIVNKLYIVWEPKSGERCWACIKATEFVIDEIRSLRGQDNQ